MDFKKFRETLEKIKQTKGVSEKSIIIKNYLLEGSQNCGTEDKSAVVFSIMRLLIPKFDRDRSSYNMKESKISRAIIKMLVLPEGNDKNVLAKSHLSGVGIDFGEVVYSILRKYIAMHKSDLSIHELNSFLDDIANRKTDSEVEEILLKIFRKSTPEDAKWIIRIILKDLKLGIDGNKILKCFHDDAPDFYSTNNNLKKVCETLSNPNVNLHELEINIFEPFRPMLSKRCDALTFKKELYDNKLYYVENKFDGERFQLHMENNVFKFFSRNGFDYTHNFGQTFESGTLTPKLKNVFNKEYYKIILDGEMMLWNKKTKKYGSKGMTLDVKKLSEEGVYQPCFCVYDIILANEVIMTNKPLKDRIKLLKQIINNPIVGVIVLSNINKVFSREDIINALNISVNNEEEGIIIKDPISIYKYSDRNSGWYKMKLDFFSDVMNDLDLLLMGGFYGNSKDTFTSFLVGIRSGTNDNGIPKYLSFGKVSSGLNDEQLDLINKKLKSQGLPYEKFTESSRGSLLFGKELPHYWIEPQNSLIFEVRASELTRTTDQSFKTPYTLRFPRVLKIRDDKPVDECLDINELLQLCQQNKPVIKLNKRKIELDEILAKKSKSFKKQKLIVPEMEERKRESDYLESYNFFVFSGTEDKSNETIENIIRRAGGRISYKIDNNVDIILVGAPNSKLQDLIMKENTCDIISVKWLERIVENTAILSYEQSEIYKLGCNYKNILCDEVDIYGVSYSDSFTVSSLTDTLNTVKKYEFSNQNNLYSLKTQSNLPFSTYVIYFDKYEYINDNTSNIIYDSFLDELEFEYRGSNKSDTITPDVNVIVYKQKERTYDLENYIKSIARNDIKIISNNILNMK